MSNSKFHWYCFTFQGKLLVGGTGCTSSTYSSYLYRNITKANIDQNKTLAGLTDKAVLVGFFYLGHMSNSEFGGKCE